MGLIPTGMKMIKRHIIGVTEQQIEQSTRVSK